MVNGFVFVADLSQGNLSLAGMYRPEFKRVGELFTCPLGFGFRLNDPVLASGHPAVQQD